MNFLIFIALGAVSYLNVPFGKSITNIGKLAQTSGHLKMGTYLKYAGHAGRYLGYTGAVVYTGLGMYHGIAGVQNWWKNRSE